MNRSLCNFKLEKFDEALYDSMRAIQLDGGISNFKAYFRAGLAMFQLLRFRDGEICIQRAKEMFKRIYPDEITDEFDLQLEGARRELLKEFGLLDSKHSQLVKECSSINSLVDTLIDSKVR